jgi:hypothetical protein
MALDTATRAGTIPAGTLLFDRRTSHRHRDRGADAMKDFDQTLVQWFDPAKGRSPLPEHMASLYETLIELAPLKPAQRAAALRALKERRPAKNLDAIIYAEDRTRSPETDVSG